MAIAPLSLPSPLAETVIGLAVFGSYGRGDFDAHSDLDLLVVVKDGSGTASEQGIVEALKPALPKEPSVSFYGEKKFRDLFEEGNLFAWHIFLEAKLIPGFLHPSDVFGRPNLYRTAAADIDGLIEILNGVPRWIASNPQNAVFELGILYVCARNIAMSASWHLKMRPDFGRYSPFGLPGPVRFPMSMERYEIAVRCRMASARGEEPPNVMPLVVEETSEMLGTWARSVSDFVRTVA